MRKNADHLLEIGICSNIVIAGHLPHQHVSHASTGPQSAKTPRLQTTHNFQSARACILVIRHIKSPLCHYSSIVTR
jgi:hypothetical protein